MKIKARWGWLHHLAWAVYKKTMSICKLKNFLKKFTSCFPKIRFIFLGEHLMQANTVYISRNSWIFVLNHIILYPHLCCFQAGIFFCLESPIIRSLEQRISDDNLFGNVYDYVTNYSSIGKFAFAQCCSSFHFWYEPVVLCNCIFKSNRIVSHILFQSNR